MKAVVAGLVVIAAILFVGLFDVYNTCPDGPVMNPLTAEPLDDQSMCQVRIQPRL